MSKEFEKLKNEITDINQAATNKEEARKKAIDEGFKKEELILEKTGVRELFEEIRDSGLVKWRIIGGIFRRYEPARIEFTRRYHDGHSIAALSLKFNRRPYSDDAGEEVAVVVVGGELCLSKFINQDYGSDNGYSYIPIKEGELATVIAKELAFYIKV
jgi:hypothetical protein